MPPPIYDIFLSFSGADRDPGRELAGALRTLGLRVFVDEDGIEPFTGITGGIQEALRTAKTLVAYYSADYAARSACQAELMTAFLAGQREGDPCGRIMVINPEPGTDHLRPVQLADARFALPTAGLAELARQVRTRAAKVERSIGDVPAVNRPRWSARRLCHVRNFSGRYRELWDLHTALHANDYPVIQETACGAFASVWGLPGAGKTALVTTYAWRFAAAFPGGVHWVSLARADPEPDALRERYTHELRRVAAEVAFDLEGVQDHLVIPSVAHGLRTSGSTSLWVVDDVPSGVDAAILDFLPFSADTGARTILIGEENAFRDLLPAVRVGPLALRDATALLNRYRPPDDQADRDARDKIIFDLGGNAGALVAAGEYLRDRHGLSSYSSLAADVDGVTHVTDTIFAGVRRLINQMSAEERALLRVAERSGIDIFPATHLSTLQRFDGVDVGAVLKRLLCRSVASREEALWRLDPLVVRAARDRSEFRQAPGDPGPEVAGILRGHQGHRGSKSHGPGARSGPRRLHRTARSALGDV